ncbi:hypothetical protein MTR67_017132 [Solanum verrucosum]|uniref:Trafficking protein particle complex subunit n=1 Tax=Solanum verrucosum TaxID=315347 RepID=A0AAF0QJ54_SOLVR|nr:hypothetical protein MTR67_017132 [Solanum verrucosum]
MINVGKIKQYSNVLERPLSKGKQEVSLSAFAFLFSELVQYNQTQVDNITELERRLEDAGYAVGARILELLCHREKGNRRETRLLGILSFVHSTVWKVLFGKSKVLSLGGVGCMGTSRLRVGSCNVGSLMGKSIELVKILQKRKVSIALGGYLVVEVRSVNDRLMAIKLVVGGLTFNVVNAYAPHAGLDEEVKRHFWEDLDEVADSLEKGTEHEDEYMISEKELLVNRFISIPKDMGAFNCGAFVAGIVRGVLENAGFPAVVTAHFVPVEGQHRPRTTILIKFAEEVLRREATLG